MCRSLASSHPLYVLFATRLYHSFPSSKLPDELVSVRSVPIPSIDLTLQNRSRPSAFVPMSLGFTSVLTDEIVSSFREYQILNEKESRVNVFHGLIQVIRFQCRYRSGICTTIEPRVCFSNTSPISPLSPNLLLLALPCDMSTLLHTTRCHLCEMARKLAVTANAL